MTKPNPMPNVTENSLESYLVTTFSKIQDQYGQKLDISPALPTLVQILTGHSDAVKKYDFIGEAACQFTIRCILARAYSHLDDCILNSLAKKFRSLSRVNKLVLKDTQLKKQERVTFNVNNAVLHISGVLFTYFGTTAVEKFIEKAVLHITAVELGEAIKQIQEDGPLQALNQMIAQSGGTIKSEVTQLNNIGTIPQWQVKIQARFTSTSTVFSHTRIETSQKKAKQSAYKDILNYFDTNPSDFEKLKITDIKSDAVHPIPILEADYCHIESSTRKKSSLPNSSSSSTSSNGDGDDSNNYHISVNDEDAIRKLSALLLGNDIEMDYGSLPQEEGSPTKKRMRDDQKPSTGLDGMFYPKEEPTTTSKTETVKAEFDYDVAKQQLLASVGTGNASTTTAKTSPTSPNITEEKLSFNPFVGAASLAIEIKPRILHYFKTIFRNNRSTLLHAMDMPGQSKSTFLSIVIQHNDKVKCDSETKQVGPPHAPVFSSYVTLQSKEYNNVFITTEGVSTRKKDAECHAFHKLVTSLK